MTSTEIANSLYKILHRKVKAAELNELAEKIGVLKITHRGGGPRSYYWKAEHIEKVKELLCTI